MEVIFTCLHGAFLFEMSTSGIVNNCITLPVHFISIYTEMLSFWNLIFRLKLEWLTVAIYRPFSVLHALSVHIINDEILQNDFLLQFLKSTKGARDRMPLTIHKLLCGLACRGLSTFCTLFTITMSLFQCTCICLKQMI